MYTINIRGKMNPKDQKMVKLELIFFKTGYARVPKVLNITGLLKNWDAKSQCFKTGTPDATTKNKLLFDIKTKYLHVIDTWESEGRNWSPVEVSHYFDVIKQNKPEVKVKSVVQMIDSLILRFNEKKRIKNGQIIDSSPNIQIHRCSLVIGQPTDRNKCMRFELPCPQSVRAAVDIIHEIG